MEGLILLNRAREAGLAVAAEGDKLVIRGPRRAESLARLLIEHKPEVLAALAPVMPPPDLRVDGFDPVDGSDPAWWRRHFKIRTIHWALSGRRRKGEAERLAYGELLDEWRKLHGPRWPTWQCAGCNEPIGGLSALLLPDEYRVHFDAERECLIRFGRRWRSEAVAAKVTRHIPLSPPVFRSRARLIPSRPSGY
jgi:hypothetical protein